MAHMKRRIVTILKDDNIANEEKITILRQWEADSLSKERSATEGMNLDYARLAICFRQRSERQREWWSTWGERGRTTCPQHERRTAWTLQRHFPDLAGPERRIHLLAIA